MKHLPFTVAIFIVALVLMPRFAKAGMGGCVQLTVTNTDSTVAASSVVMGPPVHHLEVHNPGSVDIYLNYGAAATSTCCVIIPAGSSRVICEMNRPLDECWSGALHTYSGTATQKLNVCER